MLSRTMPKIILASGNAGKIAEIQSMFSEQTEGAPIEVISQSAFNVPEAEETGLSFVENAIIKARHASSICKLPAIADDSGLEVDCLNGEPGVYSARYAGLPSHDQNNTNKLLAALKNTPTNKRNARFHCVMVFLNHPSDPSPLIAHGIWEGFINDQPVGENGFGYDPVFYIPELQCTSAQLDSTKKNAISHRAKALHQLLPLISQRLLNA